MIPLNGIQRGSFLRKEIQTKLGYHKDASSARAYARDTLSDLVVKLGVLIKQMRLGIFGSDKPAGEIWNGPMTNTLHLRDV